MKTSTQIYRWCIAVFVFTVALNLNLLAQFNGTHYIGAGEEFETIQEAVDSLVSQGVDGPVTMLVKAGHYNEQISIPAIPGASATNTITFSSENQSVDEVRIYFGAATSNANYVVYFNGCDYVTFEYFEVINSTLNSSYTSVFSFNTNAESNIIRHNKLIGKSGSPTSSTESVILANRVKLENTEISHNTIIGGSFPIRIYIYNYSTETSQNVKILNNTTNSNLGLYIDGQYNVEVSGNTINSNTGHGINFLKCYESVRVERNVVKSLGNSAHAGMYFDQVAGSIAFRALVANNLVFVDGVATVENNGISLVSSSYVDVVHNTVLLNNSNGNGAAINANGGNNLTLLNNLFAVGYLYAMALKTNTNSNLIECDNNNFYTLSNYIASWSGTNVTTIEALRSVSGKNTNSTSFYPSFISTSDPLGLIPQTHWLNNTASNQTSLVAADFNGIARSSTPDVGAFEFVPNNFSTYSGDLTIKTDGGTFKSFTEAIDSLSKLGISGPVNLLADPGTYTERIEIPAISGTSEVNRITITSATGDSTSVLMQYNSLSADDYSVIRLNSTDYLSIKKISLKNTGSTYARVITLIGHCLNVSIENCVLEGGGGPSETVDRAIIISNTQNPENLLIQNNILNNGSRGIYLKGKSLADKTSKVLVKGNAINSGYLSIYLEYYSDFEVYGNTLNAFTQRGISLSECSTPYSVHGNKLSSEVLVGGGGININKCSGANSAGWVFNNFVYVKRGSEVIGINLYESAHVGLYNNSVNVVSDNNSSKGINYYYYSLANNNIVKNNNISLTGPGYPLYVNNPAGLSDIDYNNYFSLGSRVAYWAGTNYTTLTGLSSASGKDLNSVSFDPGYLSSSDLHSNSYWIDNKGTPITGVVTVDIDGEPRDPITPDIGADEYTSTLVPYIGELTLGANGRFTSFQMAIDSLIERGILGDVVFKVESGIYNEQFIIPKISGASEQATIVFEAESGNASDVSVIFVPTSAKNYVVQLQGALYVTFRNLTLQSGSTQNSRILTFEGKCEGITIEDCTLQGRSQTTNSSADAIIFASSNDPILSKISIINNEFFNGSYAIYLENASTSSGQDLVISGNEINTFQQGIYIKYFSAPKIQNNQISFSRNDGIGINIQYCGNSTTQGMVVSGNRVFADNYSINGGLYISQSNSSPTQSALVANNIVRIGIDNSSKSLGLTITNSSYLGIYYNTVNITSNNKDDVAFYCSGSNNIYVQNNNFAVRGNLGDKGSSLGMALFVTNSTLTASDFNNYFSSGRYLASWNGTLCEELSGLRLANSMDVNSVSLFPAYRGGNQLTSNSPLLDNKGTPIAAVAVDISGNSRSESTPDIGGYEYTSTIEPLNGHYTVSQAGAFTTLDSFTEALMEFGISGNVVFEMVSETYTGNISLKDIPGAGENSWVTVRPASGEKPIITSIQDVANNYIVKLNGTDYITFENLTFSSGGTTYSTIFRIEGNSRHIHILNNVFNGVSSNSDDWTNKSSISVPTDQIVNDLLIKDNTFNNNSYGVYFGGQTNYPHSNIRVENNLFNQQYRQIYFYRTSRPLIAGNDLRNGIKAGIHLYECYVDANIVRNKVFSQQTGFLGIYIQSTNGTPAFRGLVANNFVGINSSSSNSFCIKLDYTNDYRIFYNSTLITGTGNGSAFDVYLGGNISVMNNAFTNLGTSTYTYRTQNSTAIVQSNYNNFYSTSSKNIWYNNADYATLSAYSTASNIDLNSIADDPLYTSSTDFHLQSSSTLIGKAMPLADVLTDFDLEERDPATPDVGADEYSCLFYLSPVVQNVSGCANQEEDFTLYADGDNIKWYSDLEGNNEIWSASEYTPDIEEAGTYTFYVTQSNGECTSTPIPVTLTIWPAPVLSAAITHIDCQGTEFGSINLTVSGSEGPFNFMWSNDAVSEDITRLVAGDYTVFVTAKNGCSETATYTVTSPSEILLEIITEDTNCNSNEGSATVVASGGEPGYTYLWSNGSAETVIDELYSGIYYVTVTDALGCSAIGVAAVNDIGGPEIEIEYVTNIACYGGATGAISLAVTGGATPYTYLWSNGATTKDINGVNAGVYEIEVKDTEGCRAIESIKVSEPEPLSVLMEIAQASCGQSNGSAKAIVKGGVSPYSYSWSTGATSDQISNLNLGVYTVTVSDANTCPITKHFSVSEIGSPTVIIDSIYNGTCGNSDGAIYISVYGTYDTYTYLWSTDATTEDLIGVLPGTYSVTVSDEGGCKAVQVATIPADKPEPNPICLVSVDTETNYNEVVWEKQYMEGVSHYNVYKEGSQSGVYSAVGTVGIDEESIFVDTLSNVLQRSWRYKLSVVDECGIESDLSSHHKTMHLTINLGINSSINLIWNHYEGFEYDTYHIYRLSSEGWEKIDEVPSNLTSYTDFNPVLDETLFYMIEVVHPTGCDPTKSGRNTSRSNVSNGVKSSSDNTSILMLDGNLTNINLFPNPNAGIFTIAIDAFAQQNLWFAIHTIDGRMVENGYLGRVDEKDERTISVPNLKTGNYVLVIYGDTFKAVQRFNITK
jgi:pectin methylesterase-like acyl-CoA thioesterase